MVSMFWKAALISLAGYATGILTGAWIGFWFAAGAILVFQTGWGLFCGIRLVQLTHSCGYRADAPEWDRQSFGFALGGILSSCFLLLLLVVYSQVV